jgi:hypothetical protein
MFNFLIGIVKSGVQFGPVGTAAINMPVVPAPGYYDWRNYDCGEENDVLGGNLSRCRFVHHKPYMPPVCEPRPPRWEASD